MSRASDQIKETRSYVISEDRAAGLKVKGSHWAVGYTPGHKATPLEALDYAIEDAEQKMTEAQARVVELHDLRATMVAEDQTVDFGTKDNRAPFYGGHDEEGM